jgi:hypothetical protein
MMNHAEGILLATRTTKNILSTGYYWPTLHKDAQAYVRCCDACQRMGQPTKSTEIPLQLQVSLEPFEKWGIDFVGPINPPSNQFKYILVCTYYLTKWVEVHPLKNIQEEQVVEFIYDNIFTRFGMPREIVSDRGAQFTSKLITDLMELYKIKHRKTTTYHPQENGQVEVTNRELENILTKTVQFHHRDWANKLSEVVWAYHTTWKTSTRFTPYELVYGKMVLFPIEFEIKTLHTTIELGIDISAAQKEQIAQLNMLDEFLQEALQHTETLQQQRKHWHDHFIKDKKFQTRDWALLFDSIFQDFKGKLTT